MSHATYIDVIIRTLADKQRAHGLMHAIDSVLALSTVRANPIVVANGNRYDAELLGDLKTRDDVRFVHSDVPSAGHAMILGRQLVEAPYFMYLDDDDTLLPDAMDRILERELPPGDEASSDWDVLVTNRLLDKNGSFVCENTGLATAAVGPVLALLQENWLSAGASLFATRVIDERVIDVGRDHHEWTHLAFRLASSDYRIKFMDEPTAIYRNSEDSLSKLEAHRIQELDMLRALGAEAREQGQRELGRCVEAKYRNALHRMAERCRRSRHLASAWHYHLKSLKPPYTLKYLAYTRKLMKP